MKKILILVAVLFLISGCTNIEDSTYDELISETAGSKLKIYNTYRKGYKFYLPTGLYIESTKDYNEVISNGEDTYYLYIDLISYLNKNQVEYEEGENVYFKYLSKNDVTGYAAIKTHEKGKYLVEIVYNYAKIEVIVEKSRAKQALAEAMIVLSSIDYNETFLKSLSEGTLLNYKEEEVDIFNKEGGSDTSNFLQYDEEYDGSDEDVIPDYDLIK